VCWVGIRRKCALAGIGAFGAVSIAADMCRSRGRWLSIKRRLRWQMSNKKQAMVKFEKAIQERDKFVAEGLEGYPVRLYKVTISISEKNSGRYRPIDVFTVGSFLTVEKDRNFISKNIRDIMDNLIKIASFHDKKIKLTGLDIKLVEER
jgi:hypothetical protein